MHLVARLDRAGPGDQREVLAADLAPADLEDAGLAVADLREASLYGLRIGTTLSTPGAPSSSSRATCSRSPIAPITRHLLAAEMGARGADAPRCESMTAWIWSSVAVLLHHDHHLEVLVFTPGNLRNGRARRRSAGAARWRTAESPAERLDKSPGGVARSDDTRHRRGRRAAVRASGERRCGRQSCSMALRRF